MAKKFATFAITQMTGKAAANQLDDRPAGMRFRQSVGIDQGRIRVERFDPFNDLMTFSAYGPNIPGISQCFEQQSAA